MKPVLDDDTLLFSLDDEPVPEVDASPDAKIKELEQQLANLSTQFQEYKEAVSTSFTKQLAEAPEPVKEEKKRDDDTHYFDSYAYNGRGPVISQL